MKDVSIYTDRLEQLVDLVSIKLEEILKFRSEVSRWKRTTALTEQWTKSLSRFVKKPVTNSF